MTPRQQETVAEKVLNFLADPNNILQKVNTPGVVRYVSIYDNHDGPLMKINFWKGKFSRWHMDINGLEIDAQSLSPRISATLARRAARTLSPIETNVLAAFCGDDNS